MEHYSYISLVANIIRIISVTIRNWHHMEHLPLDMLDIKPLLPLETYNMEHWNIYH
jgi:hypothetical protein